ncbi:MAG: NAD-dependent epimerase/dehydratase family protein [Isosphaeraceae bacterium]
MRRYFIAGGAGFIGSHMTRRLLERPETHVVVYDNFSSGRAWHLPGDRRLTVVHEDLKNPVPLTAAIAGSDAVFHFASNPDIAKAATQPDIDFWEGTFLTQNLLESMRVAGVSRLIYASGSGVYGDTGETAVSETYSPLLPISTYGASKLACEVLICSYTHMFDVQGIAFRFANVVGPRQTHGVAYDFIRRLLEEPTRLEILGDGQQSKSYIHVDDVIDALLLRLDQGWNGFDVFNVATEDYVTVRQIADLVADRLGLPEVAFTYTGGSRGWKGDVPVVRFDTTKLRRLGWSNRRTSIEALTESVDSMIADAKAGMFAHKTA